MKKNLKSGNQGFILIATLLVGTVLTILSSAYFSSSLSQNNIAKKQFESNQEFYSAEAGIAYGYIEAVNGATLTHKITSSATGALGVGLSGSRQFPTTSTIASDGSIVINKGGVGTVKIKIYEKGGNNIILARAVRLNKVTGILEEVGPVHRYITSHKSLYKYFQFYDNGSPDPGNYRWNPGRSQYRGKVIDPATTVTKVGGIHVNGDISLDSVGFINLSELSASRDFYYSYEPNYDTLWPQEPAYWDFLRWDNFTKTMGNYYGQASCGAGGCWIDGLAPLRRSSAPPWDFQYPLPVDVLGLGTAGGTYREVFHHPDFWVYGCDFTEDWPSPKGPIAYGDSYFWMKNYGNGDDVEEEGERKRIPKKLVSSGGNYSKDMYSGEPGDNRVLVSPISSWTLVASGPVCTAEPPIRFEVVGTIATIKYPSGRDSITKLAYKYDALRWLANKEEAKGEYLTIYSDWLKTTVTTTASGCSGATLTNDGNWDSCEYDRVTLLSVEAEAGSSAGLALGGGQGLDGSSEYDIYKAVKLYYLGGNGIPGDKLTLPDPAEGTFPSTGTTPLVQDWIKGTGLFAVGGLPSFEPTLALKPDWTADFFYWWKSRKYHHKESLTDCSAVSYDPDYPLGPGSWCFASDTLTQTTDAYGNVSKAVPAWERLFWEAWLNYWPLIHSKGGIFLRHNQVYTPAGILHAINPEWWEDLIAGTGRPNSGPDDQTMSVPYFNTANNIQAAAFATWLADPSRKLYDTTTPENSIVKFRNHAGEYLSPLNIKERYASLAQNYGLYIKQNADNTFTAKLNGSLVADNQTLANCLSGLGAWISEKQFYNPYTACKGTYDPSQKDPDEQDSSESTFIDPFAQVYGQPTCPASASDALPPTVKVIEIDLAQLKSAVTLTRPVIYIESPDYDTRLVNGYSLSAGDGTSENPGGFTLASPYDVYVKAQKVVVGGVNKGYFNYEAADKTLSSQGLDANFRPAAVITNSRVYLLSSEFKDEDAPTAFPYCYNFPASPSLRENYFLNNYAYATFSAQYVTHVPSPCDTKPASGSLTKNFLDLCVDSVLQKNMSIAGEIAYDAALGTKEVNIVKYNQYFNLAIASPFEPRGYRLERWAVDEAQSATVPLFLEGAFIKTRFWKNSDNTYVLSRYHNPATRPVTNPSACYEKRRFNLSYEGNAPGLKVYNNIPTSGVTYEYEERFWDPNGRPAGDFLASGNQSRWNQLNGVDAFNNDTAAD